MDFIHRLPLRVGKSARRYILKGVMDHVFERWVQKTLSGIKRIARREKIIQGECNSPAVQAHQL